MVKARLGLLMLLGAARLSIASAGTSHPLRMCNAADTTLTQTSSFQAPPSSSQAWPRCRKRPRSRREPPLPASRTSLSLRHLRASVLIISPNEMSCARDHLLTRGASRRAGAEYDQDCARGGGTRPSLRVDELTAASPITGNANHPQPRRAHPALSPPRPASHRPAPVWQTLRRLNGSFPSTNALGRIL